ncbi:hypothetical protein FHS18_002550 [Paenibacillus phyllosphaerae]|uniref:Helicase XPB/Ssl2 N-terminal domain-containing protein n=1 Tax=Paenibacillus phyllosphaerae TaxID=274593 RepID=A0A7W5AXC0_9BACL|nr:helicase-associated domain-containing protein [Paenibacillus phyllosphaerae]MBB3110483.1 hypothetical protein [Paenibacillus phyllosphaerae]
MRLSSSHNIYSTVASITGLGRTVLQSIVTHYGAQPFTDEKLLRDMGPGYSGAEYRIGLYELIGQELVRSVRKGWGEKVYFIPAGHYFHIHAALFDLQRPEPVSIGQLIFKDDQEQPLPYGLRIIYGLAELLHNGLKLTSKGVFPKRTIERCMLQVDVPGELVDCLKLSSFSGTGTLSFDLMLDYLVRTGVIERSGQTYAIMPDRLNNFLARIEDIREAWLIRFWMEHYALRYPQLSHAAALTSYWKTQEWYKMPSPTSESMEQWCALMAGLGWMEQRETDEGAAAYRWLFNPRPEPQGTLDLRSDEFASIHLSPDGEIFVPLDVPATIRLGLELIAKRLSSDVMTVYRLDKEYVLRAAKCGYTAGDITEFLEYASQDKMPELLAIALEGWIQDIEIDSVPLYPLPTASNSKASHVHTNVLDQDITFERKFDSLFGEAVDTESYTEIAAPQEPHAIYQGLHEIPCVWRSDMRSYHHSTRRELLERALSWRIPVKLKISDSIVPFIPERLEGDGAAWAVSGQLRKAEAVEKVRLAPDMWDEMMLIIPLPAKV